ncbi:MAG: NosD domain-containing protein [Candidatus Hodarchaeales archaeon]|jgi:parallel beta-helix repeat protein
MLIKSIFNYKKISLLLLIFYCLIINPYWINYKTDDVKIHNFDTDSYLTPKEISEQKQKIFTNHLPILITRNKDFSTVTSIGDGSSTNPWLIEDLSIDAEGISGISISNTTDNFIIQNVTVKNSIDMNSRAFKLVNVSNGIFRNNSALNSFTGFYLDNCSNNFVYQNIIFDSVMEGLVLSKSLNNLIEKNKITNSGMNGLMLQESGFNSIFNNTITKNSQNGIKLENKSQNNSITKNIVSINNYHGIYFSLARYNMLENNRISNNGFNGLYQENFSNDILSTNIITDNNQFGIKINSNDVFLSLRNEHGWIGSGTLKNPYLIANYDYHNIFSQISLINIDCYFIIENISISGTNAIAISLDNVSNGKLINNDVELSNSIGFFLSNSHNNILTENTAIHNEVGFYITGSSESNKVVFNKAVNNTKYGIVISQFTSNNELYYNYLISNNNGSIQASDKSSNNFWANGTYGNYWSDYSGSDTNNDGIGDISYLLDGDIGVKDPSPLVSLISVSSPSDQIHNIGNTSHFLTWDISTNLPPISYFIFQNDSIIQSETWINKDSIFILIENLSIGTYNYTFVVEDISGNGLSSSVFIFVVEAKQNFFIHSNISDLTIEEGFVDHTLSWTVVGNNLSYYEIFLNETLLITNALYSGIPINLTIVDLSFGTYNYTILAFNSETNFTAHSIYISVTDLTVPTINTPENIVYEEEGALGNNITWLLFDNNPSAYKIFINGTEFLSDIWQSNTPLVVNVDNLTVGIYNVSIFGYDLAGNEISNMVYITVIDTIPPYLRHILDLKFEEGSQGNDLQWYAFDKNPGNYTIEINDFSILNGSWSRSPWITFNLDDIPVGSYNVTINVMDAFGNYANDSVLITITPSDIDIMRTRTTDDGFEIDPLVIVGVGVLVITGVGLVVVWRRY